MPNQAKTKINQVRAPRIDGRPKTLDTRMPRVTDNWLIVPMAPRRLIGAISVRNIGAKQLPKPDKQHTGVTLVITDN
jgi:hypothetical protein